MESKKTNRGRKISIVPKNQEETKELNKMMETRWRDRTWKQEGQR